MARILQKVMKNTGKLVPKNGVRNGGFSGVANNEANSIGLRMIDTNTVESYLQACEVSSDMYLRCCDKTCFR